MKQHRFFAMARGRNLLSLAALSLLVLLAGAPLAALGLPDMVIEHLPGLLFTPQQQLALEVRIEDIAGIIAARCYFRYQPAGDFVYVDLAPTGSGRYQATLPAPAATVREVEYFFLAVNGAHQVVRSSSYTLQRNALIPPAPVGPSRNPVPVKTEAGIGKTFSATLAAPPAVRLSSAAGDERYGMAAGIYAAAALPGRHLVAGYFGGFRLDGQGRPVPVKGLADITPGHLDGQSATAAAADIVGPPIAGDGWKGVLYLDDDGVHSPVIATLTAVITQVGDQVTIDTSLPVGMRPRHLAGTISAEGHMLLYDEENEDWSTHYGPVTRMAVTIGDYIVPPSEEDLNPPILVVELQRDPPPVYLHLPPIYDLLLRRQLR